MIYAASDLHGDLIAFNKLKEYIEKDVDYHLIYLGDAADRGESGYKIIKWLLENDRAIYIKGNHEQIFILAALEFYKIKSRYLKNKTLEEIISNYSISKLMHKGKMMRWHYENGGESTFKDWLKDGANITIINKLNDLPNSAKYKIFDLCHATPTFDSFLSDKEEEILWDRGHLFSEWGAGRILIHGHTPTIFMGSKDALGMIYCNGSKINLDCASYKSHITAIYNLDKQELINI